MIIHAHESSFYFVDDNAHLHNIENFHSYYCKTGNVNEQVMLTNLNLTSGMGWLIFLPSQQLYPINNYIPVNH